MGTTALRTDLRTEQDNETDLKKRSLPRNPTINAKMCLEGKSMNWSITYAEQERCDWACL